ncbi:hypothetical protein G6F24_016008 [Rhizopus arrhizus]|nr:hypothetical protein G6F24_016008 [Rhizopus arrhizus]
MQRVRGWSVAACLAVSGCAMSVAPPATQSEAKESAATAAPGVVLPDTEALRVHDPVGRDYPLPAGAQRAQHVGAEGRQPGGFHPGRAASAGRPDLEAEPLAGLHAQRPGAHRSA